MHAGAEPAEFDVATPTTNSHAHGPESPGKYGIPPNTQRMTRSAPGQDVNPPFPRSPQDVRFPRPAMVGLSSHFMPLASRRGVGGLEVPALGGPLRPASTYTPKGRWQVVPQASTNEQGLRSPRGMHLSLGRDSEVTIWHASSRLLPLERRRQPVPDFL